MQFSAFIKMITCAAVTVCALAAQVEEKGKPPAEEKSNPKITINKETTYIIEPLRADGYPDYVAALNQRMGEGVTPENNAAVLLLKALGPRITTEKARKDTFRQLGIDDLPDAGEYIVDQKDAMKRWRAKQPEGTELPSDEELNDQFDRAQECPWSDDEFPIVAYWLALNVRPLEIAIEGIGRPKFFFPYVESGENYPPALSFYVPLAQESREVACLLATNAMHELRLGHVDEAWRDLMACHRLARHVAAGQCLVEFLVGCAIESIAIQGDLEVAHHSGLRADRARQMRTELEHLPRLSPMVDKIDVCERYMYLDAVAHVARAGTFAAMQNMVKLIASLSSDKSDDASKVKRPQSDLSLGKVDWDIVLKAGNDWYDRFAECGRIADVRQRRKALLDLDGDVKSLGQEARKSASYTFMAMWMTGLLSKESLGGFMAKLFPSLLLPATKPSFGAEDRLRLMAKMDGTALALAAYRADHGHYPERLDELMPKYIAEIPDDVFAEKPTPIRYRREGGAYLMWSVFNNGVDDNGRSSSDDPPGDDWVLRPVPAHGGAKN
jgi:hypothetical protein